MTYEEWRCVRCHRTRRPGDPTLSPTLTDKYRSGQCVGCKRALRMFERRPAMVWDGTRLTEVGIDDPGTSHAGLGDALRDDGMATALSNASDGTDAAWIVEAQKHADILIVQRREFTSEDITDRAGLPMSRNSVGAFMGKLSRSGRIGLVGYRKGTRDSQHSRRIAVWRAV